MTRYTKRITLKRLNEVLSLDASTGILRWKVCLNSRCSIGLEAGYIDSKGYRYIGIDGQIYYAHVLVWFMTKGRWPTRDIDHRNHHEGDNRPSNLRLATAAQNLWNGRFRKNMSGHRGVYLLRGKWQVLISKNNKRHYLGVYTDYDVACSVADDHAKKLHGQFANVV